MASFIWNIMGVVSGVMVLAGVFLTFVYVRSDEASEAGLTFGNFISSPGFGMIALGLVMYSVSGRARKAIKKKREEQGF